MKKILIFISMIFVLFACNTNNGSKPNGKKKLSKEEVAEVYNDVAAYMNNLSNGNSQKNVRRKYQESDDYSTLQSITALVKWAEILYSDEDFIYSEKFVKFSMDLGSLIDTYWLTEYDVENNKFYSVLVLGSGDLFEDFYQFYYFDVDYHYDTDEIKGFEIRQALLNTDEINLHFKYENNLFYEYNPFLDDEDVSYVRRENNSSSNTSQGNSNSSSSTSQGNSNSSSSTSQGNSNTTSTSSESVPMTIKDQTLTIRNMYRSVLNDVVVIDKDYTQAYIDAMAYAFGE